MPSLLPCPYLSLARLIRWLRASAGGLLLSGLALSGFSSFANAETSVVVTPSTTSAPPTSNVTETSTPAVLAESTVASGPPADAPTPPPPPPASGPHAGTAEKGTPAPTPSSDDLYSMGQQLFDAFAPPEVKAQYEFPSRDQFGAFLEKFNRALETGSMEEFAGYEDEAKALLVTLRTLPEYADYADWLAARIDEMGAAKTLTKLPQPPVKRPPSPPPPKPEHPDTPKPPSPPSSTPPSQPPPASPSQSSGSDIPYFNFWVARLAERPRPAQANHLIPVLKPVFAATGLPTALVWVAEVESGLNPSARSPSGACGLYQLMPDTAKRLGLSTFLPDERTDPAKSASAAASYLHELHTRFGSWPLALAAYNAGEGRVQRTLAQHHATTYADIASALPAETRLYVPKILATIQLREGIPPESL